MEVDIFQPGVSAKPANHLQITVCCEMRLAREAEPWQAGVRVLAADACSAWGFSSSLLRGGETRRRLGSPNIGCWRCSAYGSHGALRSMCPGRPDDLPGVVGVTALNREVGRLTNRQALRVTGLWLSFWTLMAWSKDAGARRISSDGCGAIWTAQAPVGEYNETGWKP